MAVFVVVVTVTPMGLAMPIVVDSVTVFESIGSMAIGPMFVGATTPCHAHEARKRTEHRQPRKGIHSLILLENDASRDNKEPRGRVATRANPRTLRPSRKAGIPYPAGSG